MHPAAIANAKPCLCSLPQMAGGSASALSLSRPAQALRVLRPVGSLSHPEVTFVTRLRPSRLPDRAARQLPDLSTIIRVESSSTDDSRLQALPKTVLSICKKGADRRPLLNHLVGSLQDGGRQLEAEGLRSLEVDREYEPRRLLDWQFGGGGALQDAVDLAGCAPHQHLYIGPVGHEAALDDEIAPAVEHRQTVLRGKRDDVRAVEDGKAVREDNESVELLRSCGAEGRLELLGRLGRDRRECHLQRGCGSLGRGELTLGRGLAWVVEHADAPAPGKRTAQALEPLRRE